jgi:hypothetical protein
MRLIAQVFRPSLNLFEQKTLGGYLGGHRSNRMVFYLIILMH